MIRTTVLALAMVLGISGMAWAEVKSPTIDVKKIPWPMKCINGDDFTRLFGTNLKLVAEQTREFKDREVVERRRVVMDSKGRIIIYVLIEGTNRQFDHCVIDLWPDPATKFTPPGAGDPA